LTFVPDIFTINFSEGHVLVARTPLAESVHVLSFNWGSILLQSMELRARFGVKICKLLSGQTSILAVDEPKRLLITTRTVYSDQFASTANICGHRKSFKS
jgi:hypothetical protein